jgi:hypothetical protein
MRETAMFLFRDLVTQEGDTIKLHQEKITEFGYCWWGWWKKPIEKLPLEFLLNLIPEGGSSTEVLLFDCGTYNFYRVNLQEVAISPSHAGMLSPDLDKTPGYYQHLRLVVWLKLLSISRVQEPTRFVKKLTHVDFPTWRDSRYEKHRGMQVRDPQELDEMLVTLWQVRVDE